MTACQQWMRQGSRFKHFHEPFPAALGDYTVTSGTSGHFGVTGGVLSIAAHTSLDVSAIERPVTPSMLAHDFAVSFRLDALHPNDAALMEVLNGGAFVFGVNPARQDIYDALQRCRLTLGSDMVVIGASALPVGVWHRARVLISAGAGNTTYTVHRLDTMALVASGVLPSAHTPYAVSTLRFWTDNELPPVTTGAASYDNIDIYGV
jgi:hypothetical protein